MTIPSLLLYINAYQINYTNFGSEKKGYFRKTQSSPRHALVFGFLIWIPIDRERHDEQLCRNVAPFKDRKGLVPAAACGSPACEPSHRGLLGGEPPHTRRDHDRAHRRCPGRGYRSAHQAASVPAHVRVFSVLLRGGPPQKRAHARALRADSGGDRGGACRAFHRKARRRMGSHRPYINSYDPAGG